MPSFRLYLTFRTCCMAVIAGIVLASPHLTTAGPAKKSAANDSETSDKNDQETKPTGNTSVYDKVVPSVCVIEPEINGEHPTRGTGWVFDAERRLLLTNDHVTEGATECLVYFPLMENGQVVTEEDRNIDPDRAIRGKVVDSDRNLDLAIVQLESLPDSAAPLSISPKSATPGQSIHSIAGNSMGSQSFWTYSTGHVRQLVQGKLANNGDAKLLESDMATNQGNSGGPVFDDQGHVVAVVEGHRTDGRLVSIYVDRESVQEYLDDALKCVEPKTNDDYLSAIRRHLDGKRTSTAMDLAAEAVKKEPTAKSFTARGECFAQLSDLESARGDFEEALRLDSNYAEAHYWLGVLARWDGDVEKGVEHYTEAIRREPKVGLYRLERGLVRYEADKFNEAWKDFNEAVQFAEVSTDALVYRSACEIELGKVEEAANTLVKLVQDGVPHVKCCYFLGKISEKMNDPTSAEKYYLAAIGIDEQHTDSEPVVALTELYRSTDRTGEATQLIEQMMPHFQEDPQVWFERANLLKESNPSEAMASLEKAKELDPEHADQYELTTEPTAEEATEPVSVEADATNE